MAGEKAEAMNLQLLKAKLSNLVKTGCECSNLNSPKCLAHEQYEEILLLLGAQREHL